MESSIWSQGLFSRSGWALIIRIMMILAQPEASDIADRIWDMI